MVVSIAFVTIFFFPKAKETQKFIEKQKELNREINELSSKYDKIVEKSITEIDTELTKLTSFIPNNINIGEIGIYVNESAQKLGNQVQTLNLNETKQLLERETSNVKNPNLENIPKLGRVNAPFKLTGTKDSLFAFLDYLVESGRAIDYDEISISGVKDNWSLNFMAVHYYLTPPQNVKYNEPIPSDK